MNKKFAFLIGLVAVVPNVYADSSDPAFSLGIERYTEKYHETVDGASFMNEDARLTGITAGYHLYLTPLDALNVSARVDWGKSDYSSASGTASGLVRQTYDLRATYSHDVALPYATLSPEIGLGYRSLQDHLEDIGEGGYRRKSQYTYATLGLGAKVPLGANWAIRPKANFNYLLAGEQTSEMSESSTTWSCGDMSNNQKHGYGYEASIGLDRRMPGNTMLTLTTFYRYWHLSKSDTSGFSCTSGPAMVQYTGYEPQNVTKEFGLNLSYSFF